MLNHACSVCNPSLLPAPPAVALGLALFAFRSYRRKRSSGLSTFAQYSADPAVK